MYLFYILPEIYQTVQKKELPQLTSCGSLQIIMIRNQQRFLRSVRKRLYQ